MWRIGGEECQCTGNGTLGETRSNPEVKEGGYGRWAATAAAHYDDLLSSGGAAAAHDDHGHDRRRRRRRCFVVVVVTRGGPSVAHKRFVNKF